MFVLLSLPHTGTTFTRSFLSASPGVDGEINLEQLGHGDPPEGLYVLHQHFNPHTWLFAAPWCRRFRPVMPVRDPLLSAITHHTRGGTIDAANWALASVVMDAHVAQYLPLDLLDTEAKRHAGLSEVLRTRGLDRGPPLKHCRDWACAWSARANDPDTANTSGRSPLKTAYQARDFLALRAAIPDQIDALQTHERSLRPWLERIGYRDLMWWS